MSFTAALSDIVSENRNGLLGVRPGWDRVPLRSVATILNGFPFESSRFTKDKGTPLIRIRDIVPGRTETYYQGEFDQAYLVEAGDLLVGMDGDFNSALWTGEPALLNQRVCKVTPDETRYSKRFLALVLPGYLAAINAHTPSVTVKHLSSRTIADIPLPCPPLPEQRRIVAEIEAQFTKLDAGVAALKCVQANLKRYRAAVLKAACEGKLVPTEAELRRTEVRGPKTASIPREGATNRAAGARGVQGVVSSGLTGPTTFETGEQLLQRILAERRKYWAGRGKYKEPVDPDSSKLPRIPDGWVWATLPQLGELSRGKSKHRPRDDAQLYGGKYPFIQTGDIRRACGTIREYTQTYSELGLQQSRLWRAGTMCITIAANIAETGILTFDACFPDSVVGFVHSGDQVTTRYVEFFIRTAKEKLAQYAPATAQKNINLDVLENVAVPLPPLAEQTRIVAEVERRLSVIDELETLVATNLARSTRLRQAVLQQAFAPAPLARLSAGAS